MRSVGVAALATVLVAGAAGAHADSVAPLKSSSESGPEKQFLNDPRFQENQLALGDFTQWVQNLPGIDDEGYVESIHDPVSRSVEIAWYGSSSQRATIVREAAGRNIAISFRSHPYSRAQINSAVAAVAAQARDNNDFTPRQLTTFLVNPSDFAVAPGDMILTGSWSPSASKASPGQRSQTLAASLEKDSGVRIVVRPEPSGPTRYATRSNDISPFNAAGLMRQQSQASYCSTGFSVRYQGTNRTTTARHCSAQDYRAADGTATYGTGIISGASGWRILTGRGSPLMFDGAWNNAAGYNKPVRGVYAGLAVGTYVWTSGGNSGVHGNIRLYGTAQNFDDNKGAPFAVWLGQEQANRIAAAQGDSGGAVFLTTSDGGVRAAGMIQGPDQNRTDGFGNGAACGPMYVSTAGCSSHVAFTSETAILAQSGASLVTSS